MFITPAYAQSAGGQGDPLTSFVIPMVLIFLIMYFLLIRPQQKRMKEHQAMIAAVKRGDKVITAGGLIGKVTNVGAEGSDEVTVEVADGVKVTAVKSTLSSVLSKTEPADTKKK